MESIQEELRLVSAKMTIVHTSLVEASKLNAEEVFISRRDDEGMFLEDESRSAQQSHEVDMFRTVQEGSSTIFISVEDSVPQEEREGR